ncbi:MAG: HAD-IA family hydrolase [Planctomycetes bacterium]|nr:HAD-IA family hydrolase [Planctomycetota bacterium]
MSRYLIWDFDGTLGLREGGWSGALHEVACRRHGPNRVTPERLREHLHRGFPWHAPHQVRPSAAPDVWWALVQPVFENAFAAVGFSHPETTEMAAQVRNAYLEPHTWKLFDDVLPTLDSLSAAGFKHVILSNHVPELPSILDALGIAGRIRRVFNSAETGCEKPHPAAFHEVRKALPEAQSFWMIGDNYVADVTGAEKAGIPAILVRKPHAGATRYSPDVAGVAAIVGFAG